MITLSRTSCRNVCAIQEMIVTRLPVAIAPGSDTSAMIAKAIAHHIVPTTLVIFPPNVSSAALIRFMTSPFVRQPAARALSDASVATEATTEREETRDLDAILPSRSLGSLRARE